MKIGIVGNPEGITSGQEETLQRLLRKFEHSYQDLYVHTGGCVGSEKIIIELIVKNGLAREIHIHPPEDQSIRAEISPDLIKKVGIKIVNHRERPHFERNHEIADSTDVFIAVPKENEEVKDSDVWIAVRYCKRNKKKVITLFPNGKATRWPNRTQSGVKI